MKDKNLNITVVEKPDTVSYDEIHNILYQAHTQNRQDGIVMKTTALNGEELKERIGKDGMCFVALDNGKVVGTVSASILKRNRWYAKGNIVDLQLLGVVPEYKGKGIASLLMKQVELFAENKGIDVIELDTAEDNKTAVSVYQKKGYHFVTYFSSPKTAHYSVVMAKYINNKQPYSNAKGKLYYTAIRTYNRLRYRADGKKRLL